MTALALKARLARVAMKSPREMDVTAVANEKTAVIPTDLRYRGSVNRAMKLSNQTKVTCRPKGSLRSMELISPFKAGQ
jgi:hypothetical protein